MSALLRFLGGVAVAGLVATSASASPSVPSAALRARDAALSFNPTDIVPIALSYTPLKRMTNAERFARGLTPNKPHRRSPGQLRARASPTPEPSPSIPALPSSSDAPSAPASSAAPTSSAPPAPTCSSVAGKISAVNSEHPNGYIGASANSFGEYRPTTDASTALQVLLERCNGDAPSTPHSLTTTNGFSDFPILAGILGYASTTTSISPGTANYAYIGGTGNEIPAGSPAQVVPNSFSAASGVPKGVETTIWVIDSATGVMTPKWVNADGSVSTLTVIYVPGAEAYALVASVAAFRAVYGQAYITTLSFVRSSVTAPAAITTI